MIRISVRNLVEFILRAGSIDSRTAGGLDKEAMQLGSKIHRKIQRQMGADYRAEVPLKILIPCGAFELQVEGRADGIIEQAQGTTIDEIKGVCKDLDMIQEPAALHLAQAKCYAYIYAKQSGLHTIAIQMTYCNLETEAVKRFHEEFRTADLEQWFQELVERYKKWAVFKTKWKEQRNQSIKELEFPFPYRDGQKELVTSVYKTILRKKKLFIQAPTGVGKTMSAVFPAVKAVGEELGDKIFYLTAKTITRTVAEQAFTILKQQGLSLKVITLTAKEKMCFCEETVCNPEVCMYANGHYDRVNDAVFELLHKTDEMSREVLEEQARACRVCPFELALDVSVWVDAVVCDYNYLFDPNAHLRRFFSEGVREEYLFLIDEAHNLVERGREMYSATLYKEEFLSLKKAVKYYDRKLANRLESCNKQFLELKRECETYQVQDQVGHVTLNLMNLMIDLERFLEACESPEVKEQVLSFYFQVRTFLNVADRLDENYVIYVQLESDGRFKLKLFCVNPAKNIQECLDRGNSTIYFSATLLPIHYYKSLLSTEKDNYAIYAKSPFCPEHCLLLMGSDVSTKYTKRNSQMYERFALYILNTVKGKEGNYMVFFPSYRFLEDVYHAFCILLEERKENVSCVLQTQSMKEEQREEFLSAFEAGRRGSLVGFCVMGGIFSEGIDLTNEKLIGALIIGTGLPQVCCERELLKAYFDTKEKQGFDYAYLYPGINKVLQAAGRVIRTEEDCGLILLLDERFRSRQYQELFPIEWRSCEACRVDEITDKVTSFWF